MEKVTIRGNPIRLCGYIELYELIGDLPINMQALSVEQRAGVLEALAIGLPKVTQQGLSVLDCVMIYLKKHNIYIRLAAYETFRLVYDTEVRVLKLVNYPFYNILN